MNVVKVVFLGGGKREEILKEQLSKTYEIVTINNADDLIRKKGEIRLGQVFIAPVSGTDQEGLIRESISLSLIEAIGYMSQGSTVLIGAANQKIKDQANRFGVRLVELGQLNELAWLNAIPTAEGTISTLMQKLETTIYGARVLITGAGRVALTLAIRLKMLGANVLLVTKNKEEVARAKALLIPATRFGCTFGEYPILINTIPVAIIDHEFLTNNKVSLYVELASTSGLVDDDLDNDIEYLVLPGIPGKYAPKEAGIYLTQIVPELIENIFPRD